MDCTALVVYNPPTDIMASIERRNFGDMHGERLGQFVGLSNQGATCYMNSLLQTLYMTPEFRRALYLWNYSLEKDGSEEFCIPLQLQRLFGKLQLSKSVCDTVSLTKSFGWEGSEVFQQQDVQELCRVLFDALEETFKGTEVENIIDQLFAGELIDYVKCIDIDYQSERKDKFLDFSLAIKPFGKEHAMHSLTDCIEYYLQPELMDGDNQYFAESINKKVDAIKGLKFHKLPQILSIQLKRFVYEFHGESIIQKKLNDQVRFPLVLDMNKYVAARVRSETESETCSSSSSSMSSIPDKNEEFEKFLQEQIYRIKQQRQKNSKESDGQYSSSHLTDMDFDYEDFTVPDLVHYDGSVSTDQIEEERKILAEEAPVDVKQLVREHGRWVYELYGVLVHSGAISGGHYYAYIQDLESRRWFNFNDSYVSEIPDSQVQEAWGGRIKKRGTTSAATTSAATATSSASLNSVGNMSVTADQFTLSNANAYMLLYRKVSLDGNGNMVPVTFPDDSLVPKYIRDDIDRIEQEERSRKIAEELRENRLELHVLWRGAEKNILTGKKETYRSLMNQIWVEFSLYSLLEFQGYGPDNVPYHLLRLRFYNGFYKIPQDVYDFDLLADRSLRDIKVMETRVLFLESRRPDEEWEPYDKDGSTLLLIEYDDDVVEFKTPRHIRLSRGATLADLRNRMRSVVNYPPENIRFMKLVDGVNFEAKCDVLAGESSRLREELWLYDMQKIYFEENNSDIQMSPSKQLFTTISNKLTLRASQLNIAVFDNILHVDRRWSITRLRNYISEMYSIPSGSFRLLRQHLGGQEIKDTGQTLHSLNLYNDSHVAVVSGEPLKSGQYVMSVMLFMSSYTAHVKFLSNADNIPSGNHVFHDDVDSLTKADAMQCSPLATMDANVAAFIAPIDTNVDDDTHTDNDDALMEVSSNGAGKESSPAYLGYSTFDNNADNRLDISTQISASSIDVNGTNNLGMSSSTGNPFLSVSPLSTTPEPDYGDISKYKYIDSPVMESNTSYNSMHVGVDDADSIDDLPPLEVVDALYSSIADGYSATGGDSFPMTEVDDPEDLKFGEIKVVPSAFPEQFPYATKIIVEHDLLIETLRVQVANWLLNQSLIPSDLPVSCIRLREKQTHQVGRILRDGLTLRQSEIPLYDGRSIVAQILDQPESLPQSDGSVVVLVRRWHRSTWSIGEATEVFLEGSAPVSSISRSLAHLFAIDPKDIRLLVLSTYSDVLLCNLDKLYPCTARHWIDASDQNKTVNEMQWHLIDGDVLIIQDATERLKVLSNNQRKSMDPNYQLDEAYGGKANNVFQKLIHQPQPKVVTVNPIVPSKSATSNGIRIKTLRDRQRESAENLSQTAGSRNASPSLDGTLNSNPTKNLSVVTTEDDMENFWQTNGDQSGYGYSNGHSASANLSTTELHQFTQAGGLALFDDIS